jgi:hypothetical protein
MRINKAGGHLMRISIRLAVVTTVFALAGCGPGNGLTMGRVSGLVTYKGQPVELGEVLFLPDSEKGNNGVPSMGAIGKDGTYTMSTQDAGDGVIAGYHKVGIRALDAIRVGQVETPELDPSAATGKELMANKLSKRKAQSLSLKKNRAKDDAPTVSFNGNVHRFLAPKKLANPETSGIRVQISRGSNRVNFAIEEDGSVKVTQ